MPGPQVIVDLDGTLLDTRARHHASYARALQELDVEPMGRAAFWRAKRRGASWPRLLGPSIDPDAFLRSFRSHIEAPELLDTDTPQPGAVRALRRISELGFQRVLVTARRDAAALDRQLSALGLDSELEVVVTTGGKAKHLFVPAGRPVRCWIGDTEEDIAAARAIGAPVAAVSNGIRCASLLARARPDDIAPSIGSAVARLAREG